jgi:FkbM family methyltransferase
MRVGRIQRMAGGFLGQEMFSKLAQQCAARFAWFVVSRRALAPLDKALFRLATAGLGIGVSLRSQPDERLLLRRLRGVLPKSPLVIDVGANCGQYACMVHEEIHEARIIAFEPHPAAYAELLRVPGIQAINMAVGDEPGRLQLFDYASAPGSQHASVLAGVFEEIHHGATTTVEVGCTTLDSFLGAAEIGRVDLLKIDVEGFELAVLKGAQWAIANGRIGIVQFKFNEMNTISRTFLADFAKELPGYRLYRLLRSGELLDISDEPPIRRELFGYQNVVAMRI